MLGLPRLWAALAVLIFAMTSSRPSWAVQGINAASATPPASAAATSASIPPTVRYAPPRAVPTAADPALEARMLAITSELRCLVCQNQTIADSHADLAVDLRQEVREMLQQGRTDAQVRHYMTDRYGDFILYRPPFKSTTMVLWLGPALLLGLAIVALIWVIARRARLADDRFEPDPDWGHDDDAFDPDRTAPLSPRRPGACA